MLLIGLALAAEPVCLQGEISPANMRCTRSMPGTCTGAGALAMDDGTTVMLDGTACGGEWPGVLQCDGATGRIEVCGTPGDPFVVQAVNDVEDPPLEHSVTRAHWYPTCQGVSDAPPTYAGQVSLQGLPEGTRISRATLDGLGVSVLQAWQGDTLVFTTAYAQRVDQPVLRLVLSSGPIVRVVDVPLEQVAPDCGEVP